MKQRKVAVNGAGWVAVALAVCGIAGLGGCASTPLGADREAQRAYQECVDLNGEYACQREKEIAEKRRRELNERDLNRGKY